MIGLLLFVDGRSNGSGLLGSTRDDSFSVTWIPGSGDGQRTLKDTTIPGDDIEDSLEATITTEPQVRASALEVSTTDPQTVFGHVTSAIPVDDLGSLQAEPKSTPDDSSRHSERTTSEQAVNSGSGRPQTDSIPDVTRHDGKSGDGGSGKGDHANSGTNQVSFFGITARGRRVVYLIDASESMRQHRAIDLCVRNCGTACRI